jgi:hypothetical protein
MSEDENGYNFGPPRIGPGGTRERKLIRPPEKTREGSYIPAFPLAVVVALAKADAAGATWAMGMILHRALQMSGGEPVLVTARRWQEAGLVRTWRRRRRVVAQLEAMPSLFVLERRPGEAYRVRRGPAWVQ